MRVATRGGCAGVPQVVHRREWHGHARPVQATGSCVVLCRPCRLPQPLHPPQSRPRRHPARPARGGRTTTRDRVGDYEMSIYGKGGHGAAPPHPTPARTERASDTPIGCGQPAAVRLPVRAGGRHRPLGHHGAGRHRAGGGPQHAPGRARSVAIGPLSPPAPCPASADRDRHPAPDARGRSSAAGRVCAAEGHPEQVTFGALPAPIGPVGAVAPGVR